MFLVAWKKRNVIKTTGARNTPKFINLISTLNMAALFPTRSVIQKKMMKKHGLKLEILRGPTQSGVCSVKNWYIYIYKGSFVKPKHYTYWYVTAQIRSRCVTFENTKQHATFVLEKMLKEKTSFVSTQNFCSGTIFHPRWSGVLLRFLRSNNNWYKKLAKTWPQKHKAFWIILFIRRSNAPRKQCRLLEKILFIHWVCTV